MAEAASPLDFEHQLPPEIRNQIYEYVAESDRAQIARKPLSDKYLFCSKRLLAFCSETTQEEYRQVLAGRMLGPRPMIVAVVQDFDFKNVVRFLRQLESSGGLGRLLQQGSSTLHISLKFTKKFDGSIERAMTWVNISKKLAKKHGGSIRTGYSVIRVNDTLEMERFKANLRFDAARAEDSEWGKLLKAFKKAFTPEAVPRPPTIAERQQMAELDAERAYDARMRDLVAANIDPDELDSDDEEDEDVEPNILPADELETWGGDEWAKELLGGEFSCRRSA